MLRVLVSRLVTLAITLLAASFLIYGAVYLAPGDPIAFLTGGRPVSPETLEALRAQYHLDDPFLTRYWGWLTDVLHGDFGQSLVSRTAVTDLLGTPAITTAMLVTYAGVLTIVAGVGLGIVAALKKGPIDTTIVLGTVAGLALPGFVMSIVLISFFAVRLGWFPVFGAGEDYVDRLWHLTLPAIALSVSSIALVTRLTRGAMQQEMCREHVDTATSRGIARSLVIRRHVLRNSMIPITAVAGITVAGLIAGSVVIERAFNLNGLGSLLVQSVGVHDFPVVQGIVLLFVAVFVILSAVVDFLYTVLDPRLKTDGAR